MVDGAPLYTLRRLFGILVVLSTARFLYYGWHNCQIIDPLYTFPFEEFSFLPRPGIIGTYLLFSGMILGGISIMTGRAFKIGCCLFFLCFTYVELLDKTNYLNHYYFVSIIAFLLMFSDAHKENVSVSRLQINIFKFVIALVYFYAGIAKLNPDWMFHAQPLAMWLPPHADLPLIGWFFNFKETAYLFSWGGALFDITAPFFLLSDRFRPWFYPVLIVFHVLTWILFPIGIFPWVMICCSTIFFSSEAHRKFWILLQEKIVEPIFNQGISVSIPKIESQGSQHYLFKPFVIIFAFIQVLFPLRYLIYNGNVFWHESGYRFSWRVMLMEKPAWASFFVKNEHNVETEIILSDWLSKNQIKMISSQPDMIIQFSRIIKDHYSKYHDENVKVRAEVWVSLNGRRSQLLIDPYRDLSVIKNSWHERDYVMPLHPALDVSLFNQKRDSLKYSSSW